MKQLTIIDGNSLLFRAYFASLYADQSMKTSKGVPTNAVFVFANMLNKILSQLPADPFVLVAFDTGEKTFRHQALESYKAHRKPVPEDLIMQFPIARKMLEALNIFTFELDGYEGDDVAGTAARLASEQGYQVHIYTSDRDFLQLVNDNIFVKLIKKGVSDIITMDAATIFKDYGIHPHQVTDFKGLVGDASDNIPGIDGIGEKTAITLLQKFESLEAIFSNVDQLTTKQKEKIINGQNSGILSKKLAIIDTHVPLNFTIEQTRYTGPVRDTLQAFIVEYEMQSLAQKFLKQHPVTESDIAFETVSILPAIETKTIIIVPIVHDDNYLKHPCQGFIIGLNNRYFMMQANDAYADKLFIQSMQDHHIEKVCFDYKQLYVILARASIAMHGPYFDVMIAAYTLDETPSLTRAALFLKSGIILSEDPTIQAKQIGGRLLAMRDNLVAALQEKQLLHIITDIEFPLANVLARMELEGVPLDRKMVSIMEKTIQDKITTLKQDIYHYAPETLNIDSPKQVSALLFETLKLPNTKKGSTNIDVLKALQPLHPVITPLIEYRKFAKLLSTYLLALPQHLHDDGKLHPIYLQAQTTTGRLASLDPNIQNISVKDEDTKLIRKAFYYPEESVYWLSFDYSQIELRILAELSHCQALIDDFNRDEDIHHATAKRLFANGGDVTPVMRRQAKAVNFGIIYGISSWGLSEQLHISPQDASALIQQFYATYPELKKYMDGLILQLQEQKYVATLLGRRRYLKDIEGSNFQAREFAKRAAMNAPIQGTAADLLKLAMIQVDRMLSNEGYQTRLILTIHDELIFKTPQHELDAVYPKIKQIMEQAMSLQVKLKVEGNHARSWYDLK